MKKKENDIKVSVIIPVYNAEKYLRRCLDSVVDQTLKEIEIICVDDGSIDNSLRILREYEAKDSRIRILTQQNQHAGVARNTGLAVAGGEYVAFLDADDWVESNAYKTLYQAVCIKKAEVGVCRFRRFDNVLQTAHGTKIFSQTEATFSKDWGFLFLCSVTPWDKLYQRKFLVDNEITFDSLICANDRSFYFKVIKAAKKIIYTQDILINHRINNPDSLVGETRLTHYDCHFRSFEEVWQLMKDQPDCVKEAILNATLKDFAIFYKKANGEKKEKIAEQLRAYLLTMPLEYLQNDIIRKEWYPTLFDVLPERLQSEKKENEFSPDTADNPEVGQDRNSRFCRIGRVITWLPRKVRGGIRCWRENGLRYTVKRVFRKIGF